MSLRSERLKQAISRFPPSISSADALKNGLHVEEPGQSFADRTLARLELHPRSSHLLAGPSGTGKTTQLRLLERKLRERDDLTPLFVDAATTRVDLTRSGSLLQHLAPQLKALLAQQWKSSNQPAHIFLAGVYARSPSNETAAQILEIIALIKRPLVLILDPPDQLSLSDFAALCVEDLASVKQYMALVIVGPPGLTNSTGRLLRDNFNYVSFQPIHNPTLGGTMHAFLTQLVTQRAADDLLPAECCALLVHASGGVPGDLLTLTQLALEEAYVAGYNCVEPDDVARAIDKFGQKHIADLDSHDRARLHHLHQTNTFAPTDERDTALLATRRILEYTAPNGTRTFAVHPTLLPFVPDPLDSI